MSENIKLQVGVKVLLKRADEKFLLVRRSREKYKDIVGNWDIGNRIQTRVNLAEITLAICTKQGVMCSFSYMNDERQSR